MRPTARHVDDIAGALMNGESEWQLCEFVESRFRLLTRDVKVRLILREERHEVVPALCRRCDPQLLALEKLTDSIRAIPVRVRVGVSGALCDVELRECVIVIRIRARSRLSQQVERLKERRAKSDGQEGLRRSVRAVRRNVRHDERTRSDALLTRHLLADGDLQDKVRKRERERDKGELEATQRGARRLTPAVVCVALRLTASNVSSVLSTAGSNTALVCAAAMPRGEMERGRLNNRTPPVHSSKCV